MSEPEGEIAVPEIRVRSLNDGPVREDGDHVLYWMTAFRRPRYNFALQRAVEHARRLERPLLVLEGLRCDYPWASDRLHRFVIEGMLDNAAAFDEAGVAYLPYLEPEKGAGSGLLEALAERACVVVGDDYPAFFLPRMLRAAADRLDVALEAVDGNGVLPMRAAEKVYLRAYDFRRFLQKSLPEHLECPPLEDPLAGGGSSEEMQTGAGADPVQRLESLGLEEILEKWPSLLDPGEPALPDLSELPIDHTVAPVEIRGGWMAARERLEAFLDEDLADYAELSDKPEAECTSRLSPWLHFGHVCSHEVLAAIAARQDWQPDDVADSADGKREGWWNLSESAEAFLDQLVTWRELGFNMCWQRDDYDRFESLPDWALETLREHAGDEREHVYGLEGFERADTHEELWNAAQGQLLLEGRIHNYMRMVWGKKILHWSESPQRALEIMIELNDRYAVDGRDPNSYSGILWCLGRYDRPWGPEREIFGKIRYMTCDSTRRKHSVDAYVDRYADAGERLF